jgi:hypothetical protein
MFVVIAVFLGEQLFLAEITEWIPFGLGLLRGSHQHGHGAEIYGRIDATYPFDHFPTLLLPVRLQVGDDAPLYS